MTALISVKPDNQSVFEREVAGRPAVQVWGRRAMVSSMHPEASFAGLDVLRSGGNAVDAALAVATTLSVTSHNWCGPAGDSVWLVYWAEEDRVRHLDGYGRCPAAMTRQALAHRLGIDLLQDSRVLREEPPGERDTGILTALVPGTPSAWCAAWRRFGTMPLERVFDRAIVLARDGVPVTAYLAKSLANHKDKLARYKASRSVFFRRDGLPLQPGDTLVQGDLAATFERLARHAEREFTTGETAQAISQQAAAVGALLTAEDLATYEPVWREPVEGSYRGRRVVVSGAPTAGLHVLQALNILEHYPLADMPYHSADTLHILIEAIKLALVDRRRFGGDPDFSSNEVGPLLDKAYAARQAASIDSGRACRRLTDAASAANETTHFVVVDEKGNVVNATQTIGRDFGSGEMVEGTGLLMNDRSWWMSLREGANAVAPKRRANVGHAPTILFNNHRPVVSLGSPGGFGIVQYVVQTLVNVLDHGFDLQSAIEAPRFRINDLELAVGCEARFDPATLEGLRLKGHQVSKYSEWSDRVGGVEGVEVRNGNLLGGYDPRRNSLAAGY